MYAATGTMPSEEVLEQTREELGLNEPMLVQYWNWLSDCLHGDFGTSYSQHKPVAELLLDRLFPTVRLALLSLALMLAVSLPAGVAAAVWKNKPVDYLIRGITVSGGVHAEFLGGASAFVRGGNAAETGAGAFHWNRDSRK